MNGGQDSPEIYPGVISLGLDFHARDVFAHY